MPARTYNFFNMKQHLNCCVLNKRSMLDSIVWKDIKASFWEAFSIPKNNLDARMRAQGNVQHSHRMPSQQHPRSRAAALPPSLLNMHRNHVCENPNKSRALSCVGVSADALAKLVPTVLQLD